MKTPPWFTRNRFLSHLRIVTAGTLVFAAAAIVFIAVRPSSAVARSAPTNNHVPVTHQHFNSFEAITQLNNGAVSVANLRNPPSPICSTTTSSAANVDTDCEAVGHNETSIAVNPTNALNLIGSGNDFQLLLTSGGTFYYETVYRRAHVTFDGGKTWTTYPIYDNAYDANFDAAVAFDATGRAYLASLGQEFPHASGAFLAPASDVIVASSTDGGKTWTAPKRVASGLGTIASAGVVPDKDYIAAWGSGNAIVTWTAFNQGIGGSYISSPIFASVTHDGGNTWSAPTEISGTAPFCTGAQGGTKCNQDQFSAPTVAADGSIYVAFLNFSTSDSAGHDQYLVVKVDPNTGQRVAGPYKVSLVYDGFTDYPINIFGQQTYQDSEFRSNPAGNIAADPTNALHLAVVWSDMRNSTLPAPSDPYAAVTNSDIIVSQSFNGGVTWSAPTALTVARDQFQPWGAYDASGKLRIGYFDRSYDAANHKYGYTLATEAAPGTLTFSTTQLTTALSDPTQGNSWFPYTPNPAFPNPTFSIGDYSGIAVAPSRVVGLWTDKRVSTCFPFCGTGEEAFFSAAP